MATSWAALVYSSSRLGEAPFNPVDPMMPADHDHAASTGIRSSPGMRRFLPVLAILLLSLLVYAMGWHRELSLETLVRHRAIIDQFVADRRLAAIAVFIAI